MPRILTATSYEPRATSSEPAEAAGLNHRDTENTEGEFWSSEPDEKVEPQRRRERGERRGEISWGSEPEERVEPQRRRERREQIFGVQNQKRRLNHRGHREESWVGTEGEGRGYGERGLVLTLNQKISADLCVSVSLWFAPSDLCCPLCPISADLCVLCVSAVRSLWIVRLLLTTRRLARGARGGRAARRARGRGRLPHRPRPPRTRR
jgi:hypothetical protein